VAPARRPRAADKITGQEFLPEGTPQASDGPEISAVTRFSGRGGSIVMP